MAVWQQNFTISIKGCVQLSLENQHSQTTKLAKSFAGKTANQHEQQINISKIRNQQRDAVLVSIPQSLDIHQRGVLTPRFFVRRKKIVRIKTTQQCKQSTTNKFSNFRCKMKSLTEIYSHSQRMWISNFVLLTQNFFTKNMSNRYVLTWITTFTKTPRVEKFKVRKIGFCPLKLVYGARFLDDI